VSIKRGDIRLTGPFVGIALVALIMAGGPTGTWNWFEFVASSTITLALAASMLFAKTPHARRPQAWALAWLYLVAAALLRDATGGSGSGMGPLALLPVLWMAMHGNRRHLVSVIGGVGLFYAVPLLMIGAPAYPAGGARGGVLFVLLAAMIGSTVQGLLAALRRHDREREELLAQLGRLVHRDTLTDLANRRAWETAIEDIVKTAPLTGVPCSVAVLDLDHFKAINDRHGHAAGDRVLRETAAAWQREIRSCDVLARLGGDEFAVLLPSCSAEDARQLVERLRVLMPPGQSCSAGIATWNGTEPPEALVARADAALYAAKAAGRNRVLASDLARPLAAA
jgi:diguanylate cyclase (GGDEF)-like protein